jgi:hypothetical protein
MTAESRAAYAGAEYKKARERVLAAAIGRPCPGCGRTLTRENCQADHVQARALGGGAVGNLRASCRTCNHRRGSALGGRVTAAKRAAGSSSAVNHLPRRDAGRRYGWLDGGSRMIRRLILLPGPFATSTSCVIWAIAPQPRSPATASSPAKAQVPAPSQTAVDQEG